MTNQKIATASGTYQGKLTPSSTGHLAFCHSTGKRSHGPLHYTLTGCPRGATAVTVHATELHSDGIPHAGEAAVLTLSVTYNAKEGVVKVLLDSNWQHGQIRLGLMGAFIW